MDKLTYYSTALRNLGLLSTIRLEREKRFGLNRPMRLTCKGLNHPVSARRGSSDLQVFAQIFTLREYRCLDGLDLGGLIVDLGANVGYSSAYFLSRFPRCNVVAVEPYGPNFVELQKNLSPYQSRKIAVQAAIMPGAERVEASALSGQEWGATMSPSDVGDIETITIPEILNLAQAPRIALLKIDIEGAERYLFQADTNWLDSVQNIVIELHDEESEEAFYAKIDPLRYSISKCDELTVCIALPHRKQVAE